MPLRYRLFKHASLTENKLFFHDNSRNYKGRGGKLSIYQQQGGLFSFVNATKDWGERNSVEARGLTKRRAEGVFAIETTIPPKGGRQSYKDLVRLSLFSCQSEGPYPSANRAGF